MCKSRFGSFDPMTVRDFVGRAFAGARRHCPEDFGALSESDALNFQGEEYLKWLETVGDTSLRNWLEELAVAEGLLKAKGTPHDA